MSLPERELLSRSLRAPSMLHCSMRDVVFISRSVSFPDLARQDTFGSIRRRLRVRRLDSFVSCTAWPPGPALDAMTTSSAILRKQIDVRRRSAWPTRSLSVGGDAGLASSHSARLRTRSDRRWSRLTSRHQRSSCLRSPAPDRALCRVLRLYRCDDT